MIIIITPTTRVIYLLNIVVSIIIGMHRNRTFITLCSCRIVSTYVNISLAKMMKLHKTKNLGNIWNVLSASVMHHTFDPTLYEWVSQNSKIEKGNELLPPF